MNRVKLTSFGLMCAVTFVATMGTAKAQTPIQDLQTKTTAAIVALGSAQNALSGCGTAMYQLKSAITTYQNLGYPGGYPDTSTGDTVIANNGAILASNQTQINSVQAQTPTYAQNPTYWAQQIADAATHMVSNKNSSDNTKTVAENLSSALILAKIDLDLAFADWYAQQG